MIVRTMTTLLLLACLAAAQDAPLKVLATVPTYGDLAREIGGDLVEVYVPCRPGQDIHTVTATPSIMGRVRDTDLVLHTGLDAEAWLEPMLRGSGNHRLIGSTERSIVLSEGVVLKEVPTEVSRRYGDIHAFGNTHIWADPLIVRGMAVRVRDALVTLLPEHAEAITARHQDFHERLTRKLVGWLTDYKPLKGRPVVTYHRSWVYFLDRFGLERAGTLEPKPRVAPTASHLEALVETMKARDVHVVLREPFHDPDAAEFIANATGAQVLELSTHPGFPDADEGIIEHFDRMLAELAAALETEAP